MTAADDAGPTLGGDDARDDEGDDDDGGDDGGEGLASGADNTDGTSPLGITTARC